MTEYRGYNMILHDYKVKTSYEFYWIGHRYARHLRQVEARLDEISQCINNARVLETQGANNLVQWSRNRYAIAMVQFHSQYCWCSLSQVTLFYSLVVSILANLFSTPKYAPSTRLFVYLSTLMNNHRFMNHLWKSVNDSRSMHWLELTTRSHNIQFLLHTLNIRTHIHPDSHLYRAPCSFSIGKYSSHARSCNLPSIDISWQRPSGSPRFPFS